MLRKSDKTFHLFEQEVDAIWTLEAPQRGLYNGALLAVESFTEDEIVAFPVEYKYFVAGNFDPALRKKLNLHALGINAVALCGNDLLVGRRRADAALYADKYETPPCGSFDAFDIWRHVVREFEEETGLHEADIDSYAILGLFYCETTGIYDICVRLDVKPGAKLVCSQEHSLLEWWPLEKFLKLQPNEVVPTSWELVARLKNTK